MKNILRAISIFILIQVLSTQIISAQIVKTIGTDTSNTNNCPVNGYYDYSYSYSIYDASEIGMGGIITKIEYNISNSCNYTMNNQKLYLLNTSTTSFTSGNYVDPISIGATLVYNGSVTWNGSGWDSITLQVPFSYNGIDNLMIIWENRDGSWSSSNPYFYFTSGNIQKTKCASHDNSFPTTGNTVTIRPNIRITLTSLNSNDLSLESWAYPSTGVTANANMPISLTVMNIGYDFQSNYVVKYSIDNGNTWISKTQTDTLAVGSSNTVLFNQPSEMADMSNYGVYRCIGVVKNTGDTITHNDTVRENVIICNGSYSGSYIVGSDTSADFPNLIDAFDVFNSCGVSGPITLRIQNGTYNQQLEIPSIAGISANNPLTIESYSRNVNDVVFEYSATNYTNNYILEIDNKSYINIKSITFEALDSNFATSVLINSSNNITIDGCKLNSVTGSVYNSQLNVVTIKDDGITTSHDITIKNSYINNGRTSINATTNYGYNINVVNNTINNFNLQGICITTYDTVFINNNNLNSNIFHENTSLKGISFLASVNKCIISQNKVSLENGICIHVSADGNSGNPIKINNNSLIINNARMNDMGIWIYQSEYLNIDFNSILLLGGFTIPAGLDMGSSSHIKMRNNNIINLAKGYCYKTSNASNIIHSSNNNYYTNAYYLAKIGYTVCHTLYNLKTTSGKENGSSNNNVNFYDGLHIINSNLNNNGTPIVGITEDNDGKLRDATHPDRGAYEFSMFSNNAQLYAINMPVSTVHIGALPIKVCLRNMGTNNLTSDSIYYQLDSNNAVGYLWTGNLSLLAIESNILIGTDTLTIGEHTIKIWSSKPNNITDSDTENDTLSINFVAQPMPNIQFYPDTLLAPINSCDDSIVLPLKIINIGDDTLHFTENHLGKGPRDSTSIIYYNTSAATTTHTFYEFLQCIDTVFITVTLDGDFDDYNEKANIYINNRLLGIMPSSNNGVIDSSRTFYLTEPLLSIYLSEGFLKIKINNNSNVDGSSGACMHKVEIHCHNCGNEWLFQNQNYTNSIAPNDTAPVFFTFNNSDLADGLYNGSITLNSNDLLKPHINVPCILSKQFQAYNVFNLGNDTSVCDELTLNGGSSPPYIWSTSNTTQTIPVINSGTYSVTIGGIYCLASDSINITVNTSPTPNLGNDTAICENNNIVINADTFFSYNWNTGDTTQTIPVINSGTYSVTVGDGNCFGDDSINITINPLPTPNLGNDTAICENNIIIIDANSFNTYFWNTGETTQTIPVINSGTYSVTVGDGNCFGDDSINITINPLPTPNLGSDTTICGSSSIILNAGAGFTNYMWSTGNNSQTVTIDSTGIGYNTLNVYVQVTDTLSCVGSDTIYITFQNCVGMNDVDKNMFTIAVYPNPSKGQFVIESNTTAVKEVEMNITDINGRLIIHKQLKNTSGAFKEMINFRNEAKGVYFIKLSNNGVNKVFKVIIQ